MMTAARPMTIAPRPMFTSAAPWILREQRAGQRDQAVGEHEAENDVRVRVDALRAGHVLDSRRWRGWRSRCSVPKNQYSKRDHGKRENEAGSEADFSGVSSRT